MLPHTQKKREITSIPVQYFKHTGILDNLGNIARHLCFQEIIALEQALGKSAHSKYTEYPQYTDNMYAVLYKRYFPHISRKKGVSAKQHFQDTMTQTLIALKKEHRDSPYHGIFISLPPSYFLKMIENRTSLLSNRQWPRLDPQEKAITLYTAAAFFSIIKDYSFLKTLFHNHQAFFMQQEFSLTDLLLPYKTLFEGHHFFKHEIPCLFYATYGYFNTINGKTLSVEMSQLVFLKAAKYGDLALLKLLYTRIHTTLPLHINIKALKEAAFGGYLEIIVFLFNEIQELDSLKNKEQVLYFAAENGHLPILEFLGVQDPTNAMDTAKAFYKAVENGHLHILRFLLKHVKERRTMDSIGKALVHAAHHGSIHIITFLLQQTEQPLSIEYLGEALYYSIRCKHATITLVLRRYCHEHGRFAKVRDWGICNAAKVGSQEILRSLLFLQVKQSITPESLGEALYYALRLRHATILSSLLEYAHTHGLSAEATGWVLWWATRNGCLSMATFILNHFGQEISVVRKEAALLEAKKNGFIDIENLLVVRLKESAPYEKTSANHSKKTVKKKI